MNNQEKHDFIQFLKDIKLYNRIKYNFKISEYNFRTCLNNYNYTAICNFFVYTLAWSRTVEGLDFWKKISNLARICGNDLLLHKNDFLELIMNNYVTDEKKKCSIKEHIRRNGV